MLQINYNIPFLWGKYDNWVNSGVCFAEGVSSLSLTLPSENPRFGGAGVWWSGQTKEHSHIWNANICFCFFNSKRWSPFLCFKCASSVIPCYPFLLDRTSPCTRGQDFLSHEEYDSAVRKDAWLGGKPRWKPLPSPEGKSPPQLKLGN